MRPRSARVLSRRADRQPTASCRASRRTRAATSRSSCRICPPGSADTHDAQQRRLLDGFLVRYDINDYLLWYYTPMAMSFTDHLTPAAIVYDCMDELSAFKGASAQLKQREAMLMRRASLVLTGGQSLYEAKRSQHHNIHPFPSSVDVKHFAQARTITVDPPDQAAIPHPRLGFFGVIDERMDLELLRGVAEARPDWHWS